MISDELGFIPSSDITSWFSFSRSDFKIACLCASPTCLSLQLTNFHFPKFSLSIVKRFGSVLSAGYLVLIIYYPFSLRSLASLF